MSNATARRSARTRNATRRSYTNDAFKAAGLALSGSDSDSDVESSEEATPQKRRARDEDFAAAPSEGGDLAKYDSDDIGSVSDAERSELDSYGSSVPGTDDGSDLTSSKDKSRRKIQSSAVSSTQKRHRQPGKYHSRGLLYFSRSSLKDVYHERLLGNDPDEIAAYTATKLKFFYDVTVPHRSYAMNLRGGLAHSHYVKARERESRARCDWEWYNVKGGQDFVRRSQKLQVISVEQARSYLSTFSYPCSVVVGFGASRQIRTLAPLGSIDIDSTFTSPDNKLQTDRTTKRGWLLNLGQAAHSVAWVPSQHTSIQYLTVSTWTKQNGPGSHEDISAFGRWPNTPATLLIWAFQVEGGDTKPARLSCTSDPRLIKVICSDWGLIKRLEWCPVSNPSEENATGDRERHLLATIHGDGKLRITELDLPLTLKAGEQVEHIKYEKPFFESSPEDTVFTCLSWISPVSLAAGCANGHIAIWNIEQHIFEDGHPTNAAPYFYEPFHDSYVTQVLSCQPFPSHFLITASHDGYVRLTDIRNPEADVAYAARHRVGNPVIAWHHHISHALVADEMVMGVSIRKFHTSAIAVVHPSSPVQAIATSPVHASVLVAGHDGTVSICNPVRKCTATRHRVPTFAQDWARHSWRPLRDNDADKKIQQVIDSQTAAIRDPSNSTPVDREFQKESSRGLSMLSLGFAPKPVRITQMTPTPAPPSKAGKQTKKKYAIPVKIEASVPTSTIYEERSGVPTVAWNPNMRCGGWAAVGWADGLIMVNDLCWE